MLYVVVPVHNRAHVTARFLDALAAQSADDFKLVLIDDGCTDDTVSIAECKLPAERLIVLKGDGQLWWAGALQMAYEHLLRLHFDPQDAVLIVNDDVTFAPDFLRTGMAVLSAYPGSCIQALGVDGASGSVDRGAIADVVRLRFRAAEPGEPANCLSTRGLLMNAQTFIGSGGFHPRWLPHYLSDYEFTLRLRRRGTPLLVDERFTAQIDLELTGLGRHASRGVRRLWADAFSNRAKFNPKHWTAFVVLACPAWVVPVHITRIWLGFARSLVAAAFSRAGGGPA
jgi:GT2 family glycosyltransferase